MKSPKAHMSSLWTKVFCNLPSNGSVPKALGQELWKRPLKHLKAEEDDKAFRRTLPKRLLNVIFKLFKENVHLALAQLQVNSNHAWRPDYYELQPWVLCNSELTSLAPRSHKITMFLSCDTPQIHHLFSPYQLHIALTPFTPNHLKCLQSNR